MVGTRRTCPFVTPENDHQRPQWGVTSLGRLIHPMCMRPVYPVDPLIDALRVKNIAISGSMHLSSKFLDDNENSCTRPESTEVEEVGHILEVTPLDDAYKTPPHAFNAELDLAAESTSALTLLNALFGEANADCGVESLDSDVELTLVYRVCFSMRSDRVTEVQLATFNLLRLLVSHQVIP